jgi:hypothetical protein
MLILNAMFQHLEERKKEKTQDGLCFEFQAILQ